jgi:phosphoadenosine phosphosulfate reductase
MEFDKIFKMHKRIVFMCSGGKDSIAALYYLKHYWDQMVVGWVNTGDLAPEVEQFMQDLSKKIPNFVAVYSDSNKWREENGWPSPIVPIDKTALGELLSEKKEFKVTAYTDCCRANIWVPLKQLADHVGATAVLTGQRKEDDVKAPTKNGEWKEGLQMFYPIDDWSTDDVMEYLDLLGIRGARFSAGDTSIDCLTCTGYPKYTDRTAYIKKHHPKSYKEAARRWELIATACEEEHNYLLNALHRG